MSNEKYVCAYCGAEYDDPVSRAKCELECDEKRQQEEAKQKKARLAAEKKVRQMEIQELCDTLNDRVMDYNRLYPDSSVRLKFNSYGDSIFDLFW